MLRNCNNINPNFGLDPLSPATYPTAGAYGMTPATTPPPGFTGLTNCYRRRRSVAAVKQQVDCRAGDRLAGRLQPRLQHARQQPEPDPRPARRDSSGFRGRRRRRELHPHHRRCALVLRDHVRHRRGAAPAGRPYDRWGGKTLRMLDHFQMGPNLVRGFATAGIGPRDLTFGTSQDALGGTMYWGASVETQMPDLRRAEGLRHADRAVRRCRLGLGLHGSERLPGNRHLRSRRSIRSPARTRTR